MQLLDLPLVLFQDIIEILVAKSPPVYRSATRPSILELRLVNGVQPKANFLILGMLICFLGLFDREITKYWARLDLCSQIIFEERCLDPPRGFIARLLREHIGLTDRNLCAEASLTHAAVDLLAEHFVTSAGETKPRELLLRDACHGLAQSNVYRRFFTRGGCRKPPVGKRFQHGRCKVLRAAMRIAMQNAYHSVLPGLVALTRYNLTDQGNCGQDCFQRFIVSDAIRSGHADVLRTCWGSEPANLNKVPRLRPALPAAIKAGHDDVLDVITAEASKDADSASIVMDITAECQRWEIVQKLLASYGTRLGNKELMSTLCWASRHGNNDVILGLMKHNIHPQTESRPECKRWPICEAVLGGHLDTVQLLLDNGAMGNDIESHVEVLARNVAISGNFALFKLLKDYYFWKPACEHVFLPLAAEHGHVEFAKYALSRKIIAREMDMEIAGVPASIQLQYFSLFRAVARGHGDIVRLLVRDAGVDPSQQPCWVQDIFKATAKYRIDESVPSILPIVLAVDSGNVAMVRLLVDELGVEPLSEDEWATFGYPNEEYWWLGRIHRRETWRFRMKDWATSLHLGDEYKTRYTDVPYSSVRTAYLAARKLSV